MTATDTPAKAVDVEVHGYVQGVGYRYSCQAEAMRLGVTGWARNDDAEGTVSGHFEGPGHAVDALVAHPRGRAVGGRRHRTRPGLAANDLDVKMIDRHRDQALARSSARRNDV